MFFLFVNGKNTYKQIAEELLLCTFFCTIKMPKIFIVNSVVTECADRAHFIESAHVFGER